MSSTIVLIGGYAIKHLYLALEPYINSSHQVDLYVDLHFTQTSADDYDDFPWGQLRGDFPWMSQGLLPKTDPTNPNEVLTFKKVKDWHEAFIKKVMEKRIPNKLWLYEYVGAVDKSEKDKEKPYFQITGDDSLMTTSGIELESNWKVDFKKYEGDFHIFDCRRIPASLGYTGFTIIERFLTFEKFFKKATIDIVIVGFSLSAIWAAELAWIRDETQSLKNTYKFVRPVDRDTDQYLTDEQCEAKLDSMSNSRNEDFIKNQLKPRLKEKNLFVEPSDKYISLSDLKVDDKHKYQPTPMKPDWAINNKVEDSELIVFYEEVKDDPENRICLSIALGIQAIGFKDIDLTGSLKADDGNSPSKKYHCFSKATTFTDIAPPYIKGSVAHWLYRGLVLVFKTINNAKYDNACKLELMQLIWVMENAKAPTKTYESHLETALSATKVKFDSTLLSEPVWTAYRTVIDSLKTRPKANLDIVTARALMITNFAAILPNKSDAAQLGLALSEVTEQISAKL